jgi:hypothetical protein
MRLFHPFRLPAKMVPHNANDHSLTLVALLCYVPACALPDFELGFQFDVKLVFDPLADRFDKPLHIAALAAFVSYYKVGVFFTDLSAADLQPFKPGAVNQGPCRKTTWILEHTAGISDI